MQDGLHFGTPVKMRLVRYPLTKMLSVEPDKKRKSNGRKQKWVQSLLDWAHVKSFLW